MWGGFAAKRAELWALESYRFVINFIYHALKLAEHEFIDSDRENKLKTLVFYDW